MLNITVRKHCDFCTNEKLIPAARRLPTYLYELAGLRPFYCRHCRDVYWRFRALLPVLLLGVYGLTYTGLRVTASDGQHAPLLAESLIFAPAQIVEDLVRGQPGVPADVPDASMRVGTHGHPPTAN